MKQKINLRLITIAVIAIAATTISITFAFYTLFVNQVKRDLKINADILKSSHYFESDSSRDIIYDLKTDDDELRITWIDSDGTVLYDNDNNASLLENHLFRPEIQAALKNGSGETVRKSDTMNMSTFYYAVRLDNGTVLRVSTQAENIQSVFLTAMPLIAAIIAVIIVLCIILSHFLTKQLIRPIEAMAENMEDTDENIPYKEFRPFADTIRRQHADIISAAKTRQDFTANVSHELKTPLTAISGYAELLENHMADDESHDHFINEIRRNADRLLILINDIIRLSELDHAEHIVMTQEIDLYEVAQKCVEEQQISANLKNIDLILTGESCNVSGNKELLSELADNIIQNAVRYNNKGGCVWVTVVKNGGEIILTVKDNGIGIPKEDIERIFERFYRVDKSRSKETGGTGLGLAIVKHIAELHNAKIEIESELGKGTTVKIIM